MWHGGSCGDAAARRPAHLRDLRLVPLRLCPLHEAPAAVHLPAGPQVAEMRITAGIRYRPRGLRRHKGIAWRISTALPALTDRSLPGRGYPVHQCPHWHVAGRRAQRCADRLAAWLAECDREVASICGGHCEHYHVDGDTCCNCGAWQWTC